MIQLFFWLDLSQPSGYGTPLGKEKGPLTGACTLLGAAGVLPGRAPSASSSMVSREVGVVLVNVWGEGCLLSSSPALASRAFSAFLFKPFPHLDVLFGLASSKDLEMDLVTDDCRIWHIRGEGTFILCSLHIVDFKRHSGLNHLPSQPSDDWIK